MNNKNATKLSAAELVSALQEKLTPDELSALMGVLSDKENPTQNNNITILPTDYIDVMSLLPYPLNLSTKERGQGNLYKFQSFGEKKRIIYSHLAEIIENHRNFLESGYFFIMNPSVIRLHGLDDLYKKILTKEKMEEILSGTDLKNIIELYQSSTPAQQETLVTMIVEKLRDNPDSVDLNIVDRLSRVSKINIQEIAEESRRILNIEKEE